MPSNKNATLRYRTIDSLLCSDEWRTVEELIHACEEALFNESGVAVKVSRVTIYKDLDFLRALDGVVIDKQPGKPVRYRYSRESKTFNGTMVPSSSYSDLAYTLEYLESISGLVSVDGTIKKIRRQLDGAGKEMGTMISFQNNLRLRNSNMLWTLYRHIREGNPLHLNYNASYHEVKEFDFQPWYLKQYSNRWFLMGWAYKITDHTGVRLDPGLRNLAVDRIETSDEGKPRIDVSRKRTRNIKLNTPGSDWYVNFNDYFSDIIGVTKYDDVDPVDIILKATIRFPDGKDGIGKYDWGRLVTKPLHPSQESWTEGDYGYVKLTVRPNPELYSTLLTYQHIEVVSPEPVRAQMIDTIKVLMSNYAAEQNLNPSGT